MDNFGITPDCQKRCLFMADDESCFRWHEDMIRREAIVFINGKGGREVNFPQRPMSYEELKRWMMVRRLHMTPFNGYMIIMGDYDEARPLGAPEGLLRAFIDADEYAPSFIEELIKSRIDYDDAVKLASSPIVIMGPEAWYEDAYKQYKQAKQKSEGQEEQPNGIDSLTVMVEEVNELRIKNELKEYLIKRIQGNDIHTATRVCPKNGTAVLVYGSACGWCLAVFNGGVYTTNFGQDIQVDYWMSI